MPTPSFVSAGSDELQNTDLFAPNIFTSGSSTVASATDQSHTGGRSIKCTVLTGEECAFGTTDDTFGLGAAKGCTSFWVRVNTVAPNTDTMLVTIYGNGASNSVLGIALATTGKLKLIAGITGPAPFPVNGLATLSANTWVRITLSWTITTTTNFTIKSYVNGTLDATLTNADCTLGGTATQIALYGCDIDGAMVNNSATITMWFDDIYCDDRTDASDPFGVETGVGVGRVTSKRPISNGTLNQFTNQIGSGGSSYGTGRAQQVNERPGSDANGWEADLTGSGQTEEYNVEGLAVGDVDLTGATILAVVGWARGGQVSAVSNPKMIVDGTEVAVTLNGSQISQIFRQSATPTVFPAGSGADIGFKGSISAAAYNVYEAGIMVVYNPAGAAPPAAIVNIPNTLVRPFPYAPSSPRGRM